MTKRLKATTIILQTRDEMEAVVGQIAALVAQSQALDSEYSTERTLLDARHAEKLRPIADSLKGKLALAQDWAERNPAAFGTARSLAMSYGTVGWRRANPSLQLVNKKQWSWEKVLEALRSGGRIFEGRGPLWSSYVREKFEVNKEALLSDRVELGAQLSNVGVKVVQEDDFFIDTKLTTTEPRLKEAA